MTMTNKQVADQLRLIAGLLRLQDESVFKVRAYDEAAEQVSALDVPIADVWQAGQLEEMSGVGAAIAGKIDELLSNGRLAYIDRLAEETPLGLVEMLEVPGLGPKTARTLHEALGVSDLAALEAAAKAGQLRTLPGLGPKREAKILDGIAVLARRTNRRPLGKAWPAAEDLVARLAEVPEVVAAAIAGSTRRMRDTVGGVDLAVAAEAVPPVLEAFLDLPRVAAVRQQLPTGVQAELIDGTLARLLVYPPERFGTGLIQATGSADHLRALRERAEARGWTLTDQALIDDAGSERTLATESEVYEALDLRRLPPEVREGRGELEAADAGRLPAGLVTADDIVSQLHTHSTWSDGEATIREMARAARARGLDVLAVTDHSIGLGVVQGVGPDEIRRQRAELDEVQRELGDEVRLLQGVELEILADGTLALPDEVLSELDIVVASLHSGLRQPREQVTDRLLTAIRNPHVDIIGHPTGRKIPDREPADIDLEAVYQAAAETDTALEINAHPVRLDLRDEHVRQALEHGVKLTINTDAHAPEHLDLLAYGVGTARRGWATAEAVINTWERERLLAWLAER